MFRPHKAIYRQPIANRTELGVRTATTHGEDFWQLRCQITPESPQAMYERFGLELDDPFVMFCDLQDGRRIDVGGIVEWESEAYEVVASPMLWRAEPVTATAQIALRRMSSPSPGTIAAAVLDQELEDSGGNLTRREGGVRTPTVGVGGDPEVG